MLCLLCLLVLTSAVNGATRPHIILIVADDLGWNDVSMHGADQIHTPHIDALAFSGVVLRRHYVLPVCTPSRVALMTGQYPIRTGMQGYPLKAGEPRGLPLDVPLLPQRLKGLGYTTRLIGKWHLGCMKTKYTPTQRGFDSHYGYWNGYIGYFDHSIEQQLHNGTQEFFGHDFWRDLSPTWEDDGRYATEVFTDEATRIIRSHDQVDPLFLCVSHLAVHTGSYSKMEVPSEKTAREQFAHIADPERQLYAEMVRTLDDSVGKIVSALKDTAMLDNSIIVFMSDNGGMTTGLHANKGSNWPFRGMKFTLFEGGVHGVAAAWSPLFEDRSRVMPHLMHISDWLPTLYRAAGGDPAMLWPLDGVDQWEQLSQGTQYGARSEVLVNIDEQENITAFISGHWKLVQGSFEDGALEGYFGDPGRDESCPPYDASRVVQAAAEMGLDVSLTEEKVMALREETMVCCEAEASTLGIPPCADQCLFELRGDPCEKRDVARSHPKVVRELEERVAYFREQLVAQLNQPVDERSNPSLFNNTWKAWLDQVDSGQCQSSLPSEILLLCIVWGLLKR